MQDQLRQFTAGPADNGMRLDFFVCARLDGLSRSQAQKLIDSGAVRVNGATAKKKYALKSGDGVTVDASAVARDDGAAPLPENIPVDVLYRDEHLIAVNKPAGLVVHPGHGNRDGTLVNALLSGIGALSDGSAPDRPGIVHRLDKDTAGVLVVARDNRTHAALAAQFAGRSVVKYYLGVCVGPHPAEHGLIEAPLARSRRDPLRRAVVPGGKEAVTEFWLLRHRSGISLMKFRLHTGRTHQIRVHCAHKGMPIVADGLYGGGRETVRKLPVLDRPFAYRVYSCFGRHALHAYSLTFAHPVTGAAMTVKAPPPGDFTAALETLACTPTELP